MSELCADIFSQHCKLKFAISSFYLTILRKEVKIARKKTIFKHMIESLNQLLQISSAIIIIIFFYYSVGETNFHRKHFIVL